MPGGLTLLASTNALIPTPASGKVTIYFSTDLNAPAYKDDTGLVHTLVGAAGAVGPQGIEGQQGEMPDAPLALPGPQGNPGTTGSQGPLGPSVVAEEHIYEDVVLSNPLVVRGAAWELIATQALSGAASYDFANLSQYSDLRVVVSGATCGTSMTFNVRVSIDNGATFLAASGDYISIAGTGAAANTTELVMYSPAATAARSGEILIEGINIVNAPKTSRSNVFATDSINLRLIPTNSQINAIRMMTSNAANFTGGTAYLLGRR